MFSIDSQNWASLMLKTYVFLSEKQNLWASFSQFIIWTFLFYAFAPQQIFTSIYKKNERKFLKMKKVRATFRKFLKIFEIEKNRKFSISKIFIFIQFSMKIFENFEIEKFRKFSISIFFIFHTIFNEKIENFRSRKFSQKSRKFSKKNRPKKFEMNLLL